MGAIDQHATGLSLELEQLAAAANDLEVAERLVQLHATIDAILEHRADIHWLFIRAAIGARLRLEEAIAMTMTGTDGSDAPVHSAAVAAALVPLMALAALLQQHYGDSGGTARN